MSKQVIFPCVNVEHVIGYNELQRPLRDGEGEGNEGCRQQHISDAAAAIHVTWNKLYIQ